MSESLLTLSDGEFETTVLNANLPTLVDFWAEWCAPCRALTPVVEQIASDFKGRLQVGKLNIDDNPQVPTQYAVRAVPTLILFKEGKAVDQVVGLVSQARLEEMLNKYL